MNLGWEPGNDKQNYVICISVSRGNGKIIQKEIIFSELLPLCYGEMSPKCESWRNGYWVSSTWKHMDFEYYEEYLKSTSNKIVLWQC